MNDHEPSDFDVTGSMIRWGGSFVSALGELWRKADAENQAALKAAFPGYWVAFRELSRLKAGQ